MVRMKPKVEGKNVRLEGDFYDGPPPKPGLYQGTIKHLGFVKVGSGDNKGADMLKGVFEIAEGPYKGAGLFWNKPLLDQTVGWINQFLDALTDGSQKQKDQLQHIFWDIGCDLEQEADGKLGRQIKTVGKSTKLIGRPISFIVRNGSYEGQDRPEIARFVIPVEDEPEMDEEEMEDALGEFQQDTSSNPVEDVAEEEVSSASGTAEDEVDEDDPWS